MLAPLACAQYRQESCEPAHDPTLCHGLRRPEFAKLNLADSLLIKPGNAPGTPFGPKYRDRPAITAVSVGYWRFRARTDALLPAPLAREAEHVSIHAKI